MYTFLNTVEVLPMAQVEVIQQFFLSCELNVPVVLKAKGGAPGYLALHAWIPLAEPMSRTLPTELAVCSHQATELRRFLDEFAMQVREAVTIARNETAHTKVDTAG